MVKVIIVRALEEEINKIFSEIERRVRETKAKFHFPKNKEFKL